MTSSASLLLPAWSPSDPGLSVSQDSQVTIKPRDMQSHSYSPDSAFVKSQSVHIDDAMDLVDDDFGTTDTNMTSAFSDDSDEEEEDPKNTSNALFSTGNIISNLSRTLHKSVSNSSLGSSSKLLRSKLSTPNLKLDLGHFSSGDSDLATSFEMTRSISNRSSDSNSTSRPAKSPVTPPPSRSFLSKKLNSPPPAPKGKIRSCRSYGSLRDKIFSLSPIKQSFQDVAMGELLFQSREFVLRDKQKLIQKGLVECCENCGRGLESTRRRIWVENFQVMCQDCCESKTSSVPSRSKLSTLDQPTSARLSESPRESICVNMSNLISTDPSLSSNYSSEHPEEVSFMQMDETSSSIFPFGRLHPGFGSKVLTFSSVDDSLIDSNKPRQDSEKTPKPLLSPKKKGRPWMKSKRSFSEGQMREFFRDSKKGGINLSHFFNTNSDSVGTPLSSSSQNVATAENLSENAPQNLFLRSDLYISRPGSNSGFAKSSPQALNRTKEDVDMRDWNDEERLNKHYLNAATIIIGKLGIEGDDLVVLEQS